MGPIKAGGRCGQREFVNRSRPVPGDDSTCQMVPFKGSSPCGHRGLGPEPAASAVVPVEPPPRGSGGASRGGEFCLDSCAVGQP